MLYCMKLTKMDSHVLILELHGYTYCYMPKHKVMKNFLSSDENVYVIRTNITNVDPACSQFVFYRTHKFA